MNISQLANTQLQDKVNAWLNDHKIFYWILLSLVSVAYTAQTWIYSQHQKSLLDEGNYLLKGYLFSTGKYIPFQDYGTWTNKMPLSFLVPGFFQKLFGPGLSSGRYYAFGISLLILIVALMIGNRLGNKSGSLLTGLMLAINPAPLKIFSQVLTQGLVSLLILLILVFIIGKDRTLWQILIGSFLAGLLPVTRINLLPVLPIVILYLFWEHGVQKGMLGLLFGLIPFIGIHLIYWPAILQLWAAWIPEGLFDVVDIWKQRFAGADKVHQPRPTMQQRFNSFSQGIRFQFPAMVGVFTALLLWQKKKSSRQDQRNVIFLSGLFVVLFTIHFGAAILLNFNIHAFFPYLCFFYILGIFIVVASWNNWSFQHSIWRQCIIGIGIIFISLVITISISEQSSFYGQWVEGLLHKQAFSFERGGISTANWKWWEVSQQWLGWDYSLTYRIVTVSIGMISILVIILGIRWLYINILRRNNQDLINFQLPHAIVTLFILGIILSPSKILGGGYQFYDCELGVIQQYKETAAWISGYLETDDQVYWIGKDTQVVLLDILEEKEINIFPQQLNSFNSFRIGGNVDDLTKSGFWNDRVAQHWIDQSDVLIFEDQAFSTWFAQIDPQVDLSNFVEIGESGILGCSEDQIITIYKR